MANRSTDANSGWGDEVLPGVFLTRRAGSAAEAANKTGLGILANTLAHDGSSIDFRKVYARMKERKQLKKKLEESNAFMFKYLAKERRRRERLMKELEEKTSGTRATQPDEASSVAKKAQDVSAAVKTGDKEDDDEDNDETDLLPITPEEDDRVIEESILENELILKDIARELAILSEMVSVHKCMKSGNANEKEDTAEDGADDEGDEDSSDTDDDDEGDEEGEEESEYPEDDNRPFEEDVTGIHQNASMLGGNGGGATATGRFAL